MMITMMMIMMMIMKIIMMMIMKMIMKMIMMMIMMMHTVYLLLLAHIPPYVSCNNCPFIAVAFDCQLQTSILVYYQHHISIINRASLFVVNTISASSTEHPCILSSPCPCIVQYSIVQYRPSIHTCIYQMASHLLPQQESTWSSQSQTSFSCSLAS